MTQHCPNVQVGQLRAERARYERALRREVGEDVPLQKVLDGASDWRGRAQHIILLQERLLSAQESQACPSCTLTPPSEFACQSRRGMQRLLECKIAPMAG